MQRQLLVDASFSQQSKAWRPMNKPAFVQMQWIDDPTQAKDGSSFLRVRVTQPGGSVAQDVPEGGRGGASYSFGLWLRAATGSAGPVPVALTIRALGGIQENASTPTSVGADWTFITVSLALTSDHSSIRAELYINQAGASIDIVHAELYINQAGASIDMHGDGFTDFVPRKVKEFGEKDGGKEVGEKEPSGKEFGEKEAGGKEFGEKEPSGKEPGEKEPGEKEPHEKEPDAKEAGGKEVGEKEPGGKEVGEKEPGEKEPHEKEAGGKEVGEKEPSGKEFGEKEPGDKEPFEKELGDKEPSDKEAGGKEVGEKEPDGKEFGEKEPHEKEPFDKEPGDKEPGDKEAFDKEPGDKEPGDKEAEVIIDGLASIVLEHGLIKTSQSQVPTRAEDGVLYARFPHV